MKVHNKSAKEVLIEVERLEDKRDKHHPQYDVDLRNKEKTKAYELMKAYIENLHPGDYSFFMF